MPNKFLYESKEFLKKRANNPFKLATDYKPQGDQPRAIDELCEGIERGDAHQVLLGVTGSGKTFTIANVIARTGRPALIMAPNKTLAAQLYNEFRELFPENAVEYFVSYYDYYQPEAYIPATDTYIAKDSSINEDIDRLRHSATYSLLSRNDCVIVASVSCIYGLGSADAYYGMVIHLEQGATYDREKLLRAFVDILYERNNIDFHRGTFRVRGDRVEIFPAYEDRLAIRLDFWGDALESISEIDPLKGKVIRKLDKTNIFPGTHYVTTPGTIARAVDSIWAELDERLKYFKDNNMLVEAQRLEQRTKHDIEMFEQTGYCEGIENYSRHLDGRAPGEPPPTLLDYFPPDFITFIDESHLTVSQVDGMYKGDFSRKSTLVNFGFRLPSALDNRPLKFGEFNSRLNQVVYVSATPADYEIEKSQGVVVEQIIRPTGLVDPEIILRPAEGQVDDLLEEIRKTAEKGERVLVTTLTKRMAEELKSYYEETGVRCAYLHSDIHTIERMEILRDLRKGIHDVLIGINLLREGLDLPEVSLVAILDADKEGFLRSTRSLIQTIGRASRNASGRVILYADKVTDSMKRAIEETERRRAKQIEFNRQNNITPQTIKKNIAAAGISGVFTDYQGPALKGEKEEPFEEFSPLQIAETIERLTIDMKKAAEELRYEEAAGIRDRIRLLRKELLRM